jgi:hypothetical protein
MAKKNPALTKEEIQKMHGEPIWLRNDDHNGYWYIVDAVGEYFVGISYMKERKNERIPTISEFSMIENGWTAHRKPVKGDWHNNPFPYRNLYEEAMRK